MVAITDLSTHDLKLFRHKMIAVYDNNRGTVKAEASIVLSMIEGELLERGIEIDDEAEGLIAYNTLQQWFAQLKAMLRRVLLVSIKRETSFVK